MAAGRRHGGACRHKQRISKLRKQRGIPLYGAADFEVRYYRMLVGYRHPSTRLPHRSPTASCQLSRLSTRRRRATPGNEAIVGPAICGAYDRPKALRCLSACQENYECEETVGSPAIASATTADKVAVYSPTIWMPSTRTGWFPITGGQTALGVQNQLETST